MITKLTKFNGKIVDSESAAIYRLAQNYAKRYAELQLAESWCGSGPREEDIAKVLQAKARCKEANLKLRRSLGV